MYNRQVQLKYVDKLSILWMAMIYFLLTIHVIEQSNGTKTMSSWPHNIQSNLIYLELCLISRIIGYHEEKIWVVCSSFYFNLPKILTQIFSYLNLIK